MLYRLATELAPIPRSQICLLFWPDLPDALARRNLTHLLTLLRQALPQPAMLLAQTEAITLDPQLVWSDTTAVARLLRTAQAPARLDALTEALELYRGPFLAGFALPSCPEYEAWLDQERHTWERRIDETLAAMVEAHTAVYDYPAAIAVAQRRLDRDVLAEDVHRRLIALYAAIGDRAAALRQFEACALALERELAVAPLPETRAVYELVLAGGSPLPTPGSGEPTATPMATPLATAASRPLSAVRAAPIPPGELIGRAAVLAEVLALLDRSRLLTLVGLGGVGKTRLALEVARLVEMQFSDGVTFVPLASLRDPAQVPAAIVAALGLGERDGRSPLVRLQEALGPRTLLLVLDNFEHIVAAAPDVAALLSAAPRLKVLVTSRAVLRVAGEQTYPVPPLDLPATSEHPALADLGRVGSVALFLARVRERLPSFQLSHVHAAEIAAICARLDGLPLAIELAAARAALLSPRMLLARLDRRLALLTDGPRDLPPRQRTLRATIDWSYALLDLGEQLLFDRLAVFAGGWTLEAAETISAAVGPLAVSVLDGLHALLDKHLVQASVGGDDEQRFSMLETIREYALERLIERGEATAAQHAHASYFLGLAEQAAPLLHGPEQIVWFDRLDAEYPNLRVALAWLLDTGAAKALRLAATLFQFWYVRGHFDEGHAWLERAVRATATLPDQQPGEASVPGALTRAQARLALAHFTLVRGDLIGAREQLAALVAELRPRDNDRATRRLLFQALVRLLQAEGMLSNHPDQAQLDELHALADELGDQRVAGEHALGHGRGLLYGFGRPDLAHPLIVRAEAIFRALGDSWSSALLSADLGMLALFAGNLTEAQHHFTEARASAVALRDRFLEAETLNNLGEVARLAGDDATATLEAVTLDTSLIGVPWPRPGRRSLQRGWPPTGSNRESSCDGCSAWVRAIGSAPRPRHPEPAAARSHVAAQSKTGGRPR